ncbi:serine/threonine-protein kinase [Pontixanthobacter aquaemixtae]|uniref:Protein kinase n=1 Tax=Pontixanthobacter aquaemixtae TaxID=1958940 RepID=A0A844ZWX7_9SPHN|nr:serine/threonine-protein kinase [Pontixanthobacter aquaemixtae]MXO91964.1 protein kinase [Pontixanthobacter aquaemixtae]
MITCNNCQSENPEGSSFCASCGKPLKEQVAPPLGDDLASAQTVSPYETIGRKTKKADPQLDYAEGDVFGGRYTVNSLIGRGGMGVVYRATDRHGERDVALKLIRPDVLAGEESVKRLISEGVTTQDLSHDNIVRVYNVDEADGLPYVAMEFVEGTTLAEWHRTRIAAREQVPTHVVGRIIMEVLAGLEVAHDAGIIHRDLKPQNIILTAEPDEKNAPLKILDFGIARAADAEESLAGTTMGTPGYMAPEQRTDPDLVDGSADLFALSKIFYKLLMDALPDGMWQPPSSSRSDVPVPVDELILAGISVNRQGRPQTVGEYRERLVAAMNNRRWGGPTPAPGPGPRPVPPSPPGPIDNGPKGFEEFVKVNQKPIGIGCGSLLVLVFLAALIDSCDPGYESGYYEDENSFLDSDIDAMDDAADAMEEAAVEAASPAYSVYNGSWYPESGGQPLSISLSPDGISNQQWITSSGTSGDRWEYVLDFGGKYLFRNDLLDVNNKVVFTNEFRLESDGSHVTLTERYPNGTSVRAERYHINHTPE